MHNLTSDIDMDREEPSLSVFAHPYYPQRPPAGPYGQGEAGNQASGVNSGGGSAGAVIGTGSGNVVNQASGVSSGGGSERAVVGPVYRGRVSRNNFRTRRGDMSRGQSEPRSRGRGRGDMNRGRADYRGRGRGEMTYADVISGRWNNRGRGENFSGRGENFSGNVGFLGESYHGAFGRGRAEYNVHGEVPRGRGEGIHARGRGEGIHSRGRSPRHRGNSCESFTSTPGPTMRLNTLMSEYNVLYITAPMPRPGLTRAQVRPPVPRMVPTGNYPVYGITPESSRAANIAANTANYPMYGVTNPPSPNRSPYRYQGPSGFHPQN